jgi:hypothetical protein
LPVANELFGKTILVAALIIGLVLLLAPAEYEGPMLLYINEQHAIRLMDAIGLAVLIPPWLVLSLLTIRLWLRKCGRKRIKK